MARTHATDKYVMSVVTSCNNSSCCKRCSLWVHFEAIWLDWPSSVQLLLKQPKRKTKVLTLNKYMAMGPSGARCQEWPCWLVASSKLLLCSALLCSSVSECSAVEYSEVKWSELVGEWEDCCSCVCELFLLESGSWGTVMVQEPKVRGMSTIGSRYQTTTGEDTADWKDLACAVVNCRLRELVTVL
jgi:hypothetical protein